MKEPRRVWLVLEVAYGYAMRDTISRVEAVFDNELSARTYVASASPGHRKDPEDPFRSFALRIEEREVAS